MSNQKKQEPLLGEPSRPESEEVPLTLIIPVYNCSEVIAMTFESILRQEYGSLEVIVVDAGSTDRSLEIVNSYASLVSRVYSVTEFNLPDMINRGISLASHDYVATLPPGSFYISNDVFRAFAATVVEHRQPDLIYCGSIQREIKRNPHTVLLPFEVELLERGNHPATLPACWFKTDLFERFGKFDVSKTLRAGFEFFCRLSQEEEIEVIGIDRVYVDFDYGRFSYGKVLRYAGETWTTLVTHFGMKKALLWFLSINHLVILKWLWRRSKEHLFKK